MLAPQHGKGIFFKPPQREGHRVRRFGTKDPFFKGILYRLSVTGIAYKMSLRANHIGELFIPAIKTLFCPGLRPINQRFSTDHAMHRLRRDSYTPFPGACIPPSGKSSGSATPHLFPPLHQHIKIFLFKVKPHCKSGLRRGISGIRKGVCPWGRGRKRAY